MQNLYGCTCTVLYKLYKQNNVEIPSYIAGIMASAIISDTLLFKSPTCTSEDVRVAKIANIDPEKYGLEFLKAGTDLSGFTAKELLSLDGKKTVLGDTVSAKISQVNTVDIDDVMARKADIESAMEKEIDELGLDIQILLITDIVNSNSQVIVLGKRADLVEKSYGVKLENNTALLKGIVSRKKQVIPILTENI